MHRGRVRREGEGMGGHGETRSGSTHVLSGGREELLRTQDLAGCDAEGQAVGLVQVVVDFRGCWRRCIPR